MIKKLKYNSKMENIKFISVTGAQKVPITYSYLFGMGYNVFTLVDKDKAGLKANKTISENSNDPNLYLHLLNYNIINEDKDDIYLLEDLLSEDDFRKNIPEKNTIFYKKIYDNYENIEFSEVTISNFRKLFEILIKK